MPVDALVEVDFSILSVTSSGSGSCRHAVNAMIVGVVFAGPKKNCYLCFGGLRWVGGDGSGDVRASLIVFFLWRLVANSVYCALSLSSLRVLLVCSGWLQASLREVRLLVRVPMGRLVAAL